MCDIGLSIREYFTYVASFLMGSELMGSDHFHMIVDSGQTTHLDIENGPKTATNNFNILGPASI